MVVGSGSGRNGVDATFICFLPAVLPDCPIERRGSVPWYLTY